ncbi:MAG: SdpI family protein [Myxococcota bacterium]
MGILMILTSIPLVMRRVPPNGLYGLRVRATTETPEIWYDANAVAGWSLLLAGLVLAVIALVQEILDFPPLASRELINALVGSVLVLGAAGYSWRRANYIEKEFLARKASRGSSS